jgi:hypothetical protein
MKNIIYRSGQLKPVLIDVLNQLKSKKIMLDYEFIPSLHDWPRVKIYLENINVVIQFWRSERIKSLDIRGKENANHIDIYINRIKQEDLFDFLKLKFEKRNAGFENEIGFERVLSVFQNDGFISEYRKSSELEDMNQHFDWLIVYKKRALKINIKSSDFGASSGKKSDVLYLNFTNTPSLPSDVLHEIRQKIERHYLAAT